jgi:iron(III) transport system ATP-binding protein
MTAIRIEHLTNSYGRTVVVDDVSLEIESGELFFLLGPSGCGKTTLLRAVAGFVEPDRGVIHFGGRLMNAVPPRERGTGMVFQNYALWPHMTVVQNVAFGLDVRHVPRGERDRRVAEALELVRLTGLEQSRPTQLSGGQQQRVALARALVIRPAVLLLDEPLSNLDARLRAEMREEIRRIHDETGLTTIYVTHDQKEALSLADRMAVMHRGRVEQVGRPRELYVRPRNRFVAGFLGEANMLPGRVRETASDRVVVETELGLLEGVAAADNLTPGSAAVCCIRPESIMLSPAGHAAVNRFPATIERDVFFGEVRHVWLKTRSGTLTGFLLQPCARDAAAGSPVQCAIDPDNVIVLAASEAETSDRRDRPGGSRATGLVPTV